MELQKNKIVLIGAGNVATHLGIALKNEGFSIIQVYSYTLDSAKTLGEKLEADYTNNINSINEKADIYIFSIKDSALPEILKKFPKTKGIFIHTAGSLPADVFKGFAKHYGVLYPLQTFSKNRDIVFREIPLFVEASDQKTEETIKKIAEKLSLKVIYLPSEKRSHLHLAAVFACNFVNHLYKLGTDILEEQKLDWNLLLPLIQETASKVETLHPKDAQTGPAVRYDKNIIRKHLEMLKDEPEKQELYRLLSDSIYHSK